MLRMSTGEDWNYIMWDTMVTDPTVCTPGFDCGYSVSWIFFTAYVIIQQYTMVNMFILIILQQFDLYYMAEDNVLERFGDDLANFKRVWREVSLPFEGYKIRGNEVSKFMRSLKGDLGMAKEKDPKTIERELVIMNL